MRLSVETSDHILPNTRNVSASAYSEESDAIPFKSGRTSASWNCFTTALYRSHCTLPVRFKCDVEDFAYFRINQLQKYYNTVSHENVTVSFWSIDHDRKRYRCWYGKNSIVLSCTTASQLLVKLSENRAYIFKNKAHLYKNLKDFKSNLNFFNVRFCQKWTKRS